MLTLGISPCPNDTFAFHKLVRDGKYDVILDDVEALNQRAAEGELDIVKISVAAYGHIAKDYALLRAGGAAGYGVGPIVVAREPGEIKGRVAIPGERTTAALLLRLEGHHETVPMRFDKIEDAVSSGNVYAGVLIHEGRFTYEAKGLAKVCDLGTLWEEGMGCPVPLGAIAIRRELDKDTARQIDDEIRASVRHAREHPDADRDAYVAAHAQELAPDVIARHIELYVNDYTVGLDEHAVEQMLEFGHGCGLYAAPRRAVFAY
ncbi:MAG: 1,4-dihydroxy-6-naphthoate synthase [Planctomycetota bacterium]|jgi:1,4-dihydroxy-6-naphthoate synthase